MRTIGKREVEDMAVGAAVLASGGGGDPYIGKLMALQAIDEYGPFQMISLDELPDDAFVCASHMLGAPTVLVEKVPNGMEGVGAVDALEKRLGRKFDAIMPLEAGGLNSLLPFQVAAAKGVPIVDCDGMGRAFPELRHVTWTLFDIPACPAVVCDEKGDVVTVEAVDNAWAERLSRNAAITTGGSVFMADYAMTGAQAKKASIPGTSTYCEQIGRAIREAHEQNVDPLPVILDLLGAFELFRGKLDDVARRTEGGFVRGYAHFAGIDDYAGRECELRFQNEHLLAKSGDEVLCSAPDLIAVLDIETALPITTEGMKYGARGVVIGIPVHEHWRSERGLEIAGPRYFGYDIDFVPVEERVAESANEQSVFWMSQRGSGALKVPGFDVSRSGLAAVFGNGKPIGSNALRKLASA